MLAAIFAIHLLISRSIYLHQGLADLTEPAKKLLSQRKKTGTVKP
ncbi:IcmS protein [Legionella pneumophila subsp. pneumophila LPE509]|nr:IcmS protein [Legionella pneumophila subsp. pneumophila LPE509]